MVLAIHGPIRTRLAQIALKILGVAAAVYVVWRCSVTRELSPALYRGGFVLFALAVTLVIAAVVQPRSGNPLRVALSFAPLRWIGWISYGLYLWHWPIYLVLTAPRTGLDGTELLLVRVAATFAISIASYVLVERPIRRGAFSPRVAVGGGLTAAALVWVIVLVVTTGAVSSVPASFAAAHAGAKVSTSRINAATARTATARTAVDLGGRADRAGRAHHTGHALGQDGTRAVRRRLGDVGARVEHHGQDADRPRRHR